MCVFTHLLLLALAGFHLSCTDTREKVRPRVACGGLGLAWGYFWPCDKTDSHANMITPFYVPSGTRDDYLYWSLFLFIIVTKCLRQQR